MNTTNVIYVTCKNTTAGPITFSPRIFQTVIYKGGLSDNTLTPITMTSGGSAQFSFKSIVIPYQVPYLSEGDNKLSVQVLREGKGSVGYNALSLPSPDRGVVAYASTSEGCWLAGRKWDANTGKCAGQCRDSRSTWVAAKDGKLGYCTLAVSPTVSQSVCTSSGRRYISNMGCSRRIERTQDYSARQCRYASATYIPATTASDSCKIL